MTYYTYPDRAQQTAERLAGEAFDAAAPDALAWLDEQLADGDELPRDVLRSALAFYRDPAEHLSDLRANIEALREAYIDQNSERYYDEAQQIERETAEALAEEIADAQREERLIEARQAELRG
jgi:dienelactone hydrolase